MCSALCGLELYSQGMKDMSDLIVVGFDDTEKADRALTKMVSLSKEHLVELEDAVIVVRNEEGKVHIKQSVNLTALGATSGLVTGGFGGAGGTVVSQPAGRLCHRRCLGCWHRRTVRIVERLRD